MIDAQLFIGILVLLFACSGVGLLWLWYDGRENTRQMVRATKTIQDQESFIRCREHKINKMESIIRDQQNEIAKNLEDWDNLWSQFRNLEDRVADALECRTPGSNGTVVKMCEILDGTRERLANYRKVAQNAANQWGKRVYVYSNNAGHFTHTMEKRAPSLICKKYRFSVKPQEV